MTTFIGRKMWAVVERDGEFKVLEITSTMSRTSLERHIKTRDELVLLMTKSQVEKIQGLSFYEYVKKYGKKGWNFGVYQTINSIEIS